MRAGLVAREPAARMRYGVLPPPGRPAERRAVPGRTILQAMAASNTAARFVAADLRGGIDGAGFRAPFDHDQARWPPMLRQPDIRLD